MPERRIILIPIKKKDAKTLRKNIKKCVKKGSVIYTDCWKGYSKLETLRYTHKTVNHKLNYVDPITACHTNTIKGNWNGIKRNISQKTLQQKKN